MSGSVAGIDWASQVHAVCVVDCAGVVTERFEVVHEAKALAAMTDRLRGAGVAAVAIERGDGPLVEALLGAGLSVFVVPSRQVKALRARYGSAGNKDNRFDAARVAASADGHRVRVRAEIRTNLSGYGRHR
ncbi:transposase [Micromonospora soli]|uniref:IS110 family transposase n=1 Tax=Micromonospora sp. NBRC 110009 TaxID=3061627 RepID=UPI00267377B9|nr:transposase [Micromonospora sp. NBRC 110009]WKT98540.1 transposase [Micromonospora sp. NBRC 110009]